MEIINWRTVQLGKSSRTPSVMWRFLNTKLSPEIIWQVQVPKHRNFTSQERQRMLGQSGAGINLHSIIKEPQHDFHCDALVDCVNKYKSEAELIPVSPVDEPSRLSDAPDQESESTLPTGQALPLNRLDVINMLTSEHFKGVFMHEPSTLN
ncbi:hypothetical protein TMatcc_008140 [Talaromyces marneffei ATCC 18224]